eukprot:13559289-Alexandrium_andersonii.AAC.1
MRKASALADSVTDHALRSGVPAAVQRLAGRVPEAVPQGGLDPPTSRTGAGCSGLGVGVASRPA